VPVALEDLDGRRLPGAVRAEEAEHLAAPHIEIDAAHSLTIAIRHAQSGDVDRHFLRHVRNVRRRPVRAHRAGV